MELLPIKKIRAGVLEVAYAEIGSPEGKPVFLMHGFPYDIHAYSEVVPHLSQAGCRVFVPYLRGYGQTRFLSKDTPRSGEQAALGADLLALMDALCINQAILAGYDWGGRAACVVAALWPERCAGLLSFNSYNIQNISRSQLPDEPENEHRLWYQYYFHSERGRAGLALNRRSLTKLLWKLWSPSWSFSDETFARTAVSFDHPDFVDIVVHSYRHRFGLVDGDPAYASIEALLAKQPPISVPALTFDGSDDGVRKPSENLPHQERFTGQRTHRIISGVGHNMPQEAPLLFANAVLELLSMSTFAD